MKINNTNLLDFIKKQFKLDLNGYHGIHNWERVYENTQIVAQHYNITSEVFELFLILHDSKISMLTEILDELDEQKSNKNKG